MKFVTHTTAISVGPGQLFGNSSVKFSHYYNVLATLSRVKIYQKSTRPFQRENLGVTRSHFGLLLNFYEKNQIVIIGLLKTKVHQTSP